MQNIRFKSNVVRNEIERGNMMGVLGMMSVKPEVNRSIKNRFLCEAKQDSVKQRVLVEPSVLSGHRRWRNAVHSSPEQERKGTKSKSVIRYGKQ